MNHEINYLIKKKLSEIEDGEYLKCNSPFITTLLNSNTVDQLLNIIIEQSRNNLKLINLLTYKKLESSGISIKDSCYDCKYFNPDGKHRFKCCGPNCPISLPRLQINMLLKEYKDKK